jgi:hypothetical protein
MESERCVQFADVEVLDEDDCVLLCRVGGRRHWLGVDRLRPGTTVAHRGDRGVLVLDREFALARGLNVRSLTGVPSAP